MSVQEPIKKFTVKQKTCYAVTNVDVVDSNLISFGQKLLHFLFIHTLLQAAFPKGTHSSYFIRDISKQMSLCVYVADWLAVAYWLSFSV